MNQLILLLVPGDMLKGNGYINHPNKNKAGWVRFLTSVQHEGLIVLEKVKNSTPTSTAKISRGE
jgi:hypothetical protein